jgi:glycosyltransferase involved in cell wall biosynthesis
MARIPGERAHSIQIARMCSALQEIGFNVFLVSPKRGDEFSRKATLQDIMKYYGLKTPFRHFKVQVPSLLNRAVRAGYFSWLLLSLIIQLFTLTFYLILSFFLGRNVYLYIREPSTLIVTNILGWMFRPRIVYELHEFPDYNNIGYKLFLLSLRRSYLIVTTSDFLARLTRKRLEAKKVISLHQAVDEEAFNIKYNCPTDLATIKKRSKVIMYAGQLDSWKKPEFLVDMMEFVTESNVSLVFIGGREDDIRKLQHYVKAKGLSDKIFFLGWKPPAQIPKYLSFADVLIHYSPSRNVRGPLKVFEYQNPLKIGEYMLAGRPIAAPRALGLDEVLVDGVNALLFDPHSPADAARKVSLLLGDKELGDRLASNARNAALSKYTYRARARALLELLNGMGRQKQIIGSGIG